MRKMLLAFVLCILSIPSGLMGQSWIPGIPGNESFSVDSRPVTGMLSSSDNLGFTFPKVLLNTYFQVGYQLNAVNMGIPVNVEFDPIPNDPIAHLAIGTSDVSLKNFNFWTGTIGLNAIISRDLTIFGSAGGFLPGSFREVGKLPFSLGPFGFAPEIDFTGSNLECWTIQCGVSLGNWGGGSLLLGSLWQYTSMRYDDMTILGRPGNPTATQDFLMKNWAPFIGLQYMEAGLCRAAVIYSPLMTSSGRLDCRTITPIMSDLSYNLNQPGYLVSATGEYFLPMKSPASLSLWFIGAMSSLKGNSDVGFVAGNITRTGVVSDLTMTQYSLGGGLNAAITF